MAEPRTLRAKDGDILLLVGTAKGVPLLRSSAGPGAGSGTGGAPHRTRPRRGVA